MKPLLAALLALVACGPSPGAGRPAAEAERPAVSSPSGRLGAEAVPLAHELEVELDPREPTFRARIAIDLEVRAAVPVLWLHGLGLEIERASLAAGGAVLPAIATPGPPGSELLGFSTGAAISPGPARLEIEYRGTLGDRAGLFRQRSGSSWYAFTDFEPLDARRALISFDEPRFKTPWKIALVIPSGMRGFSNMPLLSQKPHEDGRIRLEFAETPPLPTYLVAFAAGPFDVVEAPAAPIPVRAIVPRGRGHEAATALEVTPRLLEILVDFTGAPLPFPKLDLLSVPELDGAMENPGLVTFAEGILLIDQGPGPPTERRRRLLAGVIAHEIAHLWFGDWATPAWWDDLWLNEGFATWLSDVAIARLWPEIGRVVLDVVDRTPALRLDRTLDASPVRRPVQTRAEIRALFDALTYRKSGAVLEMLASYLGEAAMRGALRDYLAKSPAGSVTTAHFARALAGAAGADAAAALRSFLDQPGVPVVRAALRCESGAAHLELEQARLLAIYDAERAGAAERDRAWRIPICARFPGEDGAGRACMLLSEPRGRLDLGPGCPAWVHPNAGGAGYYHVSMAPEDLARLARADLDEREAVQLVLDVEALLAAGALAVDAALAILEPLAARDEPAVAGRVGDVLREISRSVVTDSSRPDFAARVRELYGARARELGVEARAGDSEALRELRWEVVQLAGDEGEEPEIRRRARARAGRWLASGAPLRDETEWLALRLAARGGDVAFFDAVRAALADPSASLGRRHALAAALGSFSDPALARRALDLALGDLDARVAARVMEAAADNPRTAGAALEALAGARASSSTSPRVAELARTLLSRQCSQEAAHLAAELAAADLVTEIARCAALARAHRARAGGAFESR